MTQELAGKRFAFLATDGFEQIELTQPWNSIQLAGGEIELISLNAGKIQGMHHDKLGERFDVDKRIERALAEDYDGLVLPGGVINPDALRVSEPAVNFVRDMFRQGKPIAAICHGPWMLIEAGIAKGLRVTSWPSLKTDLFNAGAIWVDAACINDAGIITSRSPEDLSEFCRQIIKEFATGLPQDRNRDLPLDSDVGREYPQVMKSLNGPSTAELTAKQV